MNFKLESELRVGQVVEIKGKKVICRIFESKNGPFIFIDGEIIKNVSIGSYVIIPVGFNLIVGKIEGEYAVEKERRSSLYNEIELISRKIEISILGTYENNIFTLGISNMPLINSDVYVATKQFLDKIFIFNTNEKGEEELSICIGKDIYNDLPITVSIEKLFANHIGIFGNTGSGKSNTLAYLYTQLFDTLKFNKKHEFIFLDYSNEYANCFEQDKTLVNLGGDCLEKLYLPRDAVFNVEFWQALSSAAEKTHKPFVKDTISEFNRKNNIKNKLQQLIVANSELDKKCANKINDYIEYIDEKENDFYRFYGCAIYIAIKKYGSSKTQYLDQSFWALLNRIEQQCMNLNKYIKFNQEDYSNIIVVNMNLLPLDDKLILSYLISNRFYKMFSERRSENNTINLIIDEAHKVLSLPRDGDNNTIKEYMLMRFEEYIKEGRKFGFYLTIASQRPSDISSMFLSQMHNYFVHRLVNQNDIDNLSNSISFLDETSFKMISSLKVGSCIYSGIAAKFPTIVQIPKLKDELSPVSNNVSITAETVLKSRDDN